MRKGTTGLRNVQLLKWCREYRIAVDWNLLYGFPGETDADYEAITAMLPRIRHLQLPGACGPIRLDRFSPYFQRPEQFGIKDVRPMPVYRFLYPIEGLRHERIAYYFHFSYEPAARASPAAQAAVRLAEALRDCADEGSLRALPHRDGGLHLADTRSQAKIAALKLSAFERCIAMRIDEVSSVAQVMDALAQAFPTKRFAEEDVRAFLDELVDLDMALTDGARQLSRPCPDAGRLASRARDIEPAHARPTRRGADFHPDGPFDRRHAPCLGRSKSPHKS